MDVKIYKLDKEKETKTLKTTLIGTFVFIAVITLISYSSRGFYADMKDLDWAGYLVMGLVFYSLVAYIFYNTYVKELKYYSLELIDEDQFAITSGEQIVTKYHSSQIKQIDIRNGNLYYIYLLEKHKRLRINDNLEEYDGVIFPYFQKMALSIQS